MTEHRSTAWTYGLFRPLDWGPDCDAEMRRMTALWNTLVEIDHASTAAYRSLVAGALDPVIAAERDAVLAELEALKTERKQRRAAARKKIPTPDLDERIAVVRERYQALKERFAVAKKAAVAKTSQQRRELEANRQAAVKRARQQSGCYWGNYNAVINSYDAARGKVIQSGGELRFRSFKGQGRIVNQIQGGLSVGGLFEGVSNQASLRPATQAEWPKRRLHPLGHILTATVFTHDRKPRHVSWPLILHRPFPDGAIIKEVHITRRKHGPTPDEWSVAFLLSAPIEEQTPAKRACGIDIGWRRLNEGVRVATIINERGERDFVVLPERIVSSFRHLDELASRRDKRVNALVATLRALPWAEAPAALADTATAMLRAPRHTARALARLAALWREHPWQREAYSQLHEELTDPYDSDLRDWRESAGLRSRIIRARLDHYRNESKRIVRRYGLIGSEKLSIAEMASSENDPTPEPAHWYRKVAAPGEFLGALKWAVTKAGGRLHEHDGKSTWVCHACGTEQVPRDPAALVASCPHCHATWDQDVNAARNLLAAALASAPVAKKDGAALAAVLPDSGGGRWGRTKRAAAEHRERSQ